MTTRHIVAMGGGGFSMDDDRLLDDFVVSLTGRRRPRICFIPTASGDHAEYIVRFYAAFGSERCIATHLGLFSRTIGELRPFVLRQDIIYVGGGNTANMLAIWRAHGLDKILIRAWEAGAVLCGLSAGSLCWFEAGVTDSFGPGLEPLHDGLGILKGSHCPHYDGEPLRRPTYKKLITSGDLPNGFAADDGAALHFVGTELHQVVASRPEAKAYKVSLISDEAVETPLQAIRLDKQ